MNKFDELSSLVFKFEVMHYFDIKFLCLLCIFETRIDDYVILITVLRDIDYSEFDITHAKKHKLSDQKLKGHILREFENMKFIRN